MGEINPIFGHYGVTMSLPIPAAIPVGRSELYLVVITLLAY